MIQSLARRDDPSVFDSYGLVVVDECHHIPAVSFQACVQRARTRRWLGLTATPYRRDRLEALIGFQCGPTRHEIKPAAVEGAELVRRELVVHHTTTEVTDDDRGAHPGRVRRARRGPATHRPDLRRRAHGRRRRAHLPRAHPTNRPHRRDRRPDSPGSATRRWCCAAGSAVKARRAVADALAAPDPDAGIVLVATGSYLGEGFDWPELDTLFLAFPLAFKGRVVQYVGRLLRSHAGKHHVELHDYVDSRIPVLDRMHTKRHPAYTTLGLRHPQAAADEPRRQSYRSTDATDDELEELIEQITVDAYGDEGYWSFLQAFEDEVPLPFDATLDRCRRRVTGDRLRWRRTPRPRRRGRARRNLTTISLLDLEGRRDGTAAHRLVAAYRRWLGIR